MISLSGYCMAKMLHWTGGGHGGTGLLWITWRNGHDTETGLAVVVVVVVVVTSN